MMLKLRDSILNRLVKKKKKILNKNIDRFGN